MSQEPEHSGPVVAAVGSIAITPTGWRSIILCKLVGAIAAVSKDAIADDVFLGCAISESVLYCIKNKAIDIPVSYQKKPLPAIDEGDAFGGTTIDSPVLVVAKKELVVIKRTLSNLPANG
jgi:hypothetical protein